MHGDQNSLILQKGWVGQCSLSCSECRFPTTSPLPAQQGKIDLSSEPRPLEAGTLNALLLSEAAPRENLVAYFEGMDRQSEKLRQTEIGSALPPTSERREGERSLAFLTSSSSSLPPSRKGGMGQGCRLKRKNEMLLAAQRTGRSPKVGQQGGQQPEVHLL